MFFSINLAGVFSVDTKDKNQNYENMRKFIYILLLTIFCGCDIFTLRDAEEPDKPPLWNSFYTTYEMALQNLEYGYEDARNINKFTELFKSDFEFYFSAQDINDYNINVVWNRIRERDMLYNLHNYTDSVKVELTPIPEQADDTQSTPIRIYRSYNLTVKRNNEIKTYVGRMELQMVQENGFWRFIKWYDYRTVAPAIHQTWGKLKYDYSI